MSQLWPRTGERSAHRVSLVVAGAVALVVALLSPIGGVPVRPAGAQASPNAGGEYTPLTPFRVLDTRPGSAVQFVGPLRGGVAVSAQVAGVPGSGITVSAVLAVAMNVTVVTPTGSGFLTVWPAGVPMPTASNLNFFPGEVLPNLVVSGVGSGGRVGIFVNAGLAHVVIDVVGYYATSAVTQRGARLVPMSPVRFMDTRVSGGALGLLQNRALRIRGVGGVPNSPSVTGVVLNVTATQPTGSTFITVYPDDVPRPWASNLNVVAGQTRPNLVMSKVGSGGGVRIHNNTGAVHIVVDVVGYYQTGASVNSFAGRVVPLTAPFRAFDTREYAVRLGPQQQEAWNFTPFVDSLNDGGIPVGPVSGLVMNVTSTQVSANSYLTLFPDGTPRPFASNLNPVAGFNIPNLAVVKLSGNDRLASYNNSGFLHYLGDVTAVILAD